MATLFERPTGRRAGAVRRSLVLAMMSMLVRGCWAFYVNSAWGLRVALRAAAVQLVVSFCGTFMLSMLHAALFRLGGTPTRGFWLSAVGTTAVALGMATLVHVLAGTPRVLVTIAPTIVIAGVTFTTVSWRLRAAQRLSDDPCAARSAPSTDDPTRRTARA